MNTGERKTISKTYDGCETCPLINKTRVYPIRETYCDKLGCKILYVGCCESEVESMPRPFVPRGERPNRHKLDIKYKKKAQKLADMLSHKITAPYHRVNEENKCTDEPNQTKYVKRFYFSNKITKYHKHMANRKVRRYKGELPGKGGYKKAYDYWWMIT